MTRPKLCTAGTLLGLALVTAGANASDGDAHAGAEILRERCLPCHGGEAKKIRGAYDLRTRAGLLRGGESGTPAVVPGQPEASPLLVAVERRNPDLVMPPKENDRLSAAEVAVLRRWIAGGAPLPEGWPTVGPPAPPKAEGDAGVRVATSRGLSAAWNDRTYAKEALWAFAPIGRPEAPSGDRLIDAAAVQTPVDAFWQARLRERGISRLAPEADPRTLVRRATFTLLGLPPTPAEIDAFVADHRARGRAAAMGTLVDRLLASPHHGEQAARLWLDVVRYADTSGLSNDFERPNAWRYRDWVIRSFNRDLPFDRFVTAQIAGDELTGDDLAGGEGLLAAGFWRMGPWEHTSMTVAAITRQQLLDDMTHAVGVTLLGLGLRCASCHDHKFDPIPTRDYYRLQAALAPIQLAERDVPFLHDERTVGFAEARSAAQARLARVTTRLRALDDKQRASGAVESSTHAAPRSQTAEANRGELGLTPDEVSERKLLDKRRAYFEREVERYAPRALSIYAGPPREYLSTRTTNPLPERRAGLLPAVHILVGGSLESRGDAVLPGVLGAVGLGRISRGLGEAHGGAADPTALPTTTEGRRTALARWLTGSENTLLSRVIVNRVWQQHFGRGLVATPNNFGKMGSRPTHPELLDWLARWFMDRGWSLKALHRLLATSAMWSRADTHPDRARLALHDPRNELLAYFPLRRLAAEELRDAMLLASHELVRHGGGPGVFPEINWAAALQPRQIMGSVAPPYVPSRTRHERNRRTIYAFRIRTLADPLLETFNRPGSDVSCDRRDETTVTPQALSLLNGEAPHARALAMAAELEANLREPRARLRAAFLRTWGRPPSTGELAAAAAHVSAQTRLHEGRRPRPRPLPSKVERRMIEEVTGEEVRWTDNLDLAGYERDLSPWEVRPATRALADLCLVLFNSNEFLYVR
jgi:hypothetical protein